MKIRQEILLNGAWQNVKSKGDLNEKSTSFALAFGCPQLLADDTVVDRILSTYTHCPVLFCSTAGEIIGDQVHDESVCLTGVEFESTICKELNLHIDDFENSVEIGQAVFEKLNADDLQLIFVLTDGTMLNGGEFVDGMNKNNTKRIPITGGLAGDDREFDKAWIGLNQKPTPGNVVALGFYGEDIVVGHGSYGGWDEFGPERTITKSENNILYEIDGKSALDLYKLYLGRYTKDLPGSGLFFPLSITPPNGEPSVVRTMLGLNEEDQSLILAGNIPEGSKMRLMKANFDQLIDGSMIAASQSIEDRDDKGKYELAIVISCAGRKWLLREWIEDEVIEAAAILGEDMLISGFYSFSEIAPFKYNSTCGLHNQTMTITTIGEKV